MDDDTTRILRKLDKIIQMNYDILTALRVVQQGEVLIMATLDDVVADVSGENTVIDSVLVLLQGLADQIKNLPPAANPADQAKIDALHESIVAKSKAMADAVVANTPPQPSTA